ncbi:MAG: hypothetical protein QOK40_2299, partial [Miltoncostaeaceae bacterium]|nr:hypothetical protein [Miltoncostaeaceae bacterium]
MPTGPPRRSRRFRLGLGGLGALIALAAGIVALGLALGWFDRGSVVGTSRGFEPSAGPQGAPHSDAWPEYGYDDMRTRANPRLLLEPKPFVEAWHYDAGSLLEFPPVIDAGRVVVGTNRGFALALDGRTGKLLWRRRLRGQIASSPALAGRLALFTTTAGRVTALDAATGRPTWSVALGAAVESSPLVADGSAYVGTLAGNVMRLSLR